MIISRTPFRISLFGGSTDYEDFYKEYGSLLIGMAIDKYSYLSARKTPDILPYKSRFAYSKTEILHDNDFSKIEHNGIRGVLQFLAWQHPVEISHFCDIPSQTGLGSSSSFVVGLINALQALIGKTSFKNELARYAIHIERKLLKEAGGIQDQIWAAYGGFNSIEILKNGDFKVKPLPISEEFVRNFINRSYLFYIGGQRESFQLASHNKNSDIYKQEIYDLAKEAYSLFQREDIDSIGYLLDSSWEAKKKINHGITSPEVDNLYSYLKNLGMIGGKLLGAGGSGFIFGLFDQPKLYSFPDFIRSKTLSYQIDYDGSKIIHR